MVYLEIAVGLDADAMFFRAVWRATKSEGIMSIPDEPHELAPTTDNFT
jgi:hypothetical protein